MQVEGPEEDPKHSRDAFELGPDQWVGPGVFLRSWSRECAGNQVTNKKLPNQVTFKGMRLTLHPPSLHPSLMSIFRRLSKAGNNLRKNLPKEVTAIEKGEIGKFIFKWCHWDPP